MRPRFILGLFAAAALCGCEPSVDTTQTIETFPPSSSPTPVPAPTPEPPTPLVAIPSATPFLTVEGHTLILEFETGGRSGYKPYPEWPQGASGVTIGIGYDLGYSSKSVILSDWKALDPTPRARLAGVSGKTGQSARASLPTVSDIYVQWTRAVDVFDQIDVARWYAATKRALPGFDALRPNCQAALISLGFNRGWSFTGPNRLEMRNIRDLVPKRDYAGMAEQERHMCRIWKGSVNENGLCRRRNAEADLILTE